jgi:hypothetical protein
LGGNSRASAKSNLAIKSFAAFLAAKKPRRAYDLNTKILLLEMITNLIL